MNQRLLAIVVILSLLGAAFVVPYTVLSEVYRWTGSFLFWIVFVLAAIGVNIWIASRWRDVD